MPVTEDRLYKPEGLNRWFAVSSILMTASILWMIEVDYARPWKDFQDDYFRGKAAMAHLDYLDANTQERTQAIELAKRGLADARELTELESGSARGGLRNELVTASLEADKAEGAWSRDNQLLDVTKDTYEKALGRYGDEHHLTHDAHGQLVDEQDEVERLRKSKEKWGDEVKRLEGLLKELEAPVELAQKQLRDLEAIAESALKKDEAFRGVLSGGRFFGLPLVSTVINLRLLDFAAPKNTPSRHQVNQYVLPNVRQRLNYLESYTTDRCTTCHIAIADPEFSPERLARKLERRLPAINEALQRQGLDPLDPPAPPTLEGFEETLPVGHVTDHWGQLSGEQQDAYFDALLGTVNSYLTLSGRRTIKLGQPLLAHPHLELYVDIDSPHPVAKMGCTVCHEGNPQETDFVQAAHTAATHEIRERWKEAYYIRAMGLPNVTFETVDHYWDRPMHAPAYTEASCAKCHTEISDIARFDGERHGQRINLGRQLFIDVGCINCHEEDSMKNARRVGPDLRRVASKLTPGFVQQWAFFPQKYRPSTRMPHLFMQENSLPDSANEYDPDPVLRTQTEVAAMAKYLFVVSAPWTPLAKPDGVDGDAERGKDLFRNLGCLACHSNIAEFGEEWITKDIVHRNHVDEQTARYRYLGMTQEERTRYAMKHFASERVTFLDPEEVRFDPDADYTPPVFSRYAPELSGIGSKVSADWLYSWLMEPTHYAAETRMPSLRIEPPEAADLVAYLLTLKNDAFEQDEFEMNTARQDMADTLVFTLLSAQRSERRSRAIMADEENELSDMLVSLIARASDADRAGELIGAMSTEDKKLVYLGNKMISHYGCYACHQIPGFETATPPGTKLTNWAEKPLGQLDFAFYDHAFHDMRHEKEHIYHNVYRPEHETLNYWSPIDDDAPEQIGHTHAAFAKHKMLNPRIWDREKIKRPYDKLKMPNYYFSDEEAEALTTFLLSRVPPRVNDVLKMDYAGASVGPIAKGRQLTRELNCVACHQIEDNAPTIQQYFRRKIGGRLEFDSVNAPPLLWGEGAKVQHNWLHKFFQDVEPLRPWLQVRMPSFTITNEQATTLVEYFAALSQSEAKKLNAAMVRVDEYITKQSQKRDTAGDAEPGADWYRRESLESSVSEITRFAVERKITRANQLNPLRSSPEQVRASHAQTLKGTRFIEALYDVGYPFVEPPAPLGTQRQFDRGFSFLKDMGCLQCHVLGPMLPGPAKTTDDFVQVYRLDRVRGEGDTAVAVINAESYAVGSVIDGHTLVSAENHYYPSGDVDTSAVFEGPGPGGQPEKIMLQAASAPNLSLTYQRLRRAWVYAWMLEPQLIQPGTKMPQNFPDGVSPFAGDPDYPGTAHDHINMLVDFLYHAGATNARADLPKLMVGDDSEDFDDDEEGFGDDFDDK